MSSFDKEDPRVIVVGAGISGLACAVTLFQHGFHNLTILEARDRIGGRIHSISTDDITFEAGAQWLQDGLDEMVKKLSNGEKIELVQAADEMACFFEDNADLVDEVAVIKAVDEFYEIYNKADSAIKSACPENMLSFLRSEWDKYISSNENLKKPIFASLFKILCHAFREHDGVKSLADAKVSSGYEKVGDERVMVKGSLSLLVKSLLKSLPSNIVKYQHEVTKCEWMQEDLNCNRNTVKVSCHTTDHQLCEFTADHVVITLPLGVLKKHHKNLFFPALNQAKVTAIDRMGYSFVNKVILHYDKPFWNGNRRDVLFIPKTLGTGLWDSIVTFYVEEDVAKNKYYVCIFFCGKEAIEIEEVDENKIAEMSSKVLQKCMRLDVVPVPKYVHVTKWIADPYSCGSYSYMAVESSGEDLKELAKPLPNDDTHSSPLQLLFAGEATHEKYFSTIHGGYYSGVREAERIVSYYSRKVK